jgi:hypothetical protein
LLCYADSLVSLTTPCDADFMAMCAHCLMRYKEDSGPENPADVPTKALSPPFSTSAVHW